MNRVKVWLIVSIVAVPAGAVMLLVCNQVMRNQLRREAQASANEIADAIALDLEHLPPVAQERAYAVELSGYINRHARIQRLQLVADDGAPGSSPMPAAKPIVFERKAAKGDVYVTERSIKLSGAGHATLAMRWSLAAF
jgi:hypothetical protein